MNYMEALRKLSDTRNISQTDMEKDQEFRENMPDLVRDIEENIYQGIVAAAADGRKKGYIHTGSEYSAETETLGFIYCFHPDDLHYADEICNTVRGKLEEAGEKVIALQPERVGNLMHYEYKKGFFGMKKVTVYWPRVNFRFEIA